ncbi:MAG TPA: O-antigen ligase family protein [Bacteroidales bacterium]|nr:O-antigen ligase family protein [Bacteroidales bacterium]
MIRRLQKYTLYLYCFSINFETWDPFHTGVDFLITKVTVLLYLSATILNYKSFYSFKGIKYFIYPILLFFSLLTFMSLKNRTSEYSTFLDISFFLNLTVLLIAINHEKREPKILLKCLYVFSFSTMLITIMFFFNIDTSYALDNRITIFKANANEIGVVLSITMLALLSIIHENKLRLGKSRYLLYITFPFMFVFLVQTGSRLAFISLLLGTLVFLFLNKSKISIKKLISIFSVLIILFVIWAFFLKNSFITERLTSSITEGDLSQRDVLWLSALELIPKHLIWGQGETGYAFNITIFSGRYSSPHNVIIEILSYTGVVGLILFLTFLVRINICAIRIFKINKEVLPILLLIPILGMIFSAQILGNKIAWFIFSYIIANSLSKSFDQRIGKCDSFIIKKNHNLNT